MPLCLEKVLKFGVEVGMGGDVVCELLCMVKQACLQSGVDGFGLSTVACACKETLA